MKSMNQASGFDWQQAVSFAARAHAGQLRKDGRTPYVAHPLRVALIVRHLFQVDDETALVAAVLHDTLEDTTVDYDDLAGEFGPAVADAVAALSKDSRLAEAQREAAYDRQLAAASWQARLVKLADVYDNFCDLVDDTKRGRAAEKIRRAIACAGDDQRLRGAIDVVEKLLKQRVAQAPRA